MHRTKPQGFGRALLVAIVSAAGLTATPISAEPLSLSEILSIAIERSPRMKASALELEVREHERRSVRGRFLPQLQTSASALVWDDANKSQMDLSAVTGVLGELTRAAAPETQQRIAAIDGGSSGITLHDQVTARVSATVQQPLLQLIAVRHAHAAATRARDASRQDAVAARRALEMDVVSAYYALVTALGMEASVQAALAQLTETERQVRDLLDAGRLEANALLKVQVQSAELEKGLLATRRGARGATATLNMLMQRPLKQPITPSPGMAVRVDGARDGLPFETDRVRALQARPEALAVALRVDAAKSAAKVARAAMLPELALTMSYELQEGMGDMQPRQQAYAGLVLRWTVWDWGSRRHEAKAAGARARQAAVKQSQLHDRIGVELEGRRRDLEEARAAVGVAERQRQYARESLRVEEERYRHGHATTTELLQAQSYVVRAESDRVAERARLERATFALRIARGEDIMDGDRAPEERGIKTDGGDDEKAETRRDPS